MKFLLKTFGWIFVVAALNVIIQIYVPFSNSRYKIPYFSSFFLNQLAFTNSDLHDKLLGYVKSLKNLKCSTRSLSGEKTITAKVISGKKEIDTNKTKSIQPGALIEDLRSNVLLDCRDYQYAVFPKIDPKFSTFKVKYGLNLSSIMIDSRLNSMALIKNRPFYLEQKKYVLKFVSDSKSSVIYIHNDLSADQLEVRSISLLSMSKLKIEIIPKSYEPIRSVGGKSPVSVLFRSHYGNLEIKNGFNNNTLILNRSQAAPLTIYMSFLPIREDNYVGTTPIFKTFYRQVLTLSEWRDNISKNIVQK